MEQGMSRKWNTCYVLAIATICLIFSPAVSALAADAPQENKAAQAQRTITPEGAFSLMAGEAEKGNGRAMLTLGNFYEQGIGTPRNFIKAMEWFSKAADAGMAEGHYNLGVCYEIGMGNSGDMKKAVEQYQKAANMGLPLALQKMSLLYFNGIGVPKNNAKAVEYLSKAADSGHSIAANELGLIYLQGLAGQKKDERKALATFVKSADMGNLEAIKNIAVVLKDGIGVSADSANALKWYLIAKKGGYPAQDLDKVIDELKGKLKPAQIKKAEEDAEKWITEFQERRQQAQSAQTSSTKG